MARIFICFIIRDTPSGGILLLEGYSFWRDTPSGGILLLEGYSFWREYPFRRQKKPRPRGGVFKSFD
jgi:hypothetical protein